MSLTEVIVPMWNSLPTLGDILSHGDLWIVAVVLGLVTVFLWHQSLHEEVRVLHHSGDELWRRIRYSDVFIKGYRPPFWLAWGTLFFSGTWHTIMHNIARHARKQPEVEYDRELVRLTDGGTIGLDWATSSVDPVTLTVYKSPPLNDDSFPIIFLHHGLCGSSRSHYILSLVNLLLKSQKFRVVCFVARGCGDIKLTTPEGFIAARTLDMRESLKRIFDRHPTSPVFGVGFSLGAGLMANYIGEEGENCKLSGGCVVSACWDFTRRSSWYRIWNKFFLARSLIDYTKKNLEMFRKNKKIDLDQALDAEYIEQYDLNAVLPVHGFKDVNEYYRKSSPLKVAHRISIPTLSLNSDDDPVCSVKGCPTEISQMGPGLLIVRTKRGGHTTWATSVDAHESWMDKVIVTWIDACNDHKGRKEIQRSIQFQSEIVSRRIRSRVKSEADLLALASNFQDVLEDSVSKSDDSNLFEIEMKEMETASVENLRSRRTQSFAIESEKPAFVGFETLVERRARLPDLIRVLKNKSMSRTEKVKSTKQYFDGPLSKKDAMVFAAAGIIITAAWKGMKFVAKARR